MNQSKQGIEQHATSLTKEYLIILYPNVLTNKTAPNGRKKDAGNEARCKFSRNLVLQLMQLVSVSLIALDSSM